MGRKKKSSKQTSKKMMTKISPEMLIIIMILIGIMLGVIIYTGAGQVGAVVNPLLGGLIGIMKYVVPVRIYYYRNYVVERG